MNLRQASSIAVLAVCLSGRLPGQSAQEIRLDAIENLELHHLKAAIVTYLGRAAVRIANTEGLDSDYGDGLAIVRGASFRGGSIEVTVSGDTAPGAPPELRGFVGIAFHVMDRSHFECFYIRPKNGRSEDQLQRNHSTQYMSIPGFPWDKLRSETPGKYESYVDLVPGQWTKLKIEVMGKIAKLYVNGAEQPTLIVNDLQTAFVEWRYWALGGTRNDRPLCRLENHRIAIMTAKPSGCSSRALSVLGSGPTRGAGQGAGSHRETNSHEFLCAFSAEDHRGVYFLLPRNAKAVRVLRRHGWPRREGAVPFADMGGGVP